MTAPDFDALPLDALRRVAHRQSLEIGRLNDALRALRDSRPPTISAELGKWRKRAQSAEAEVKALRAQQGAHANG